MKRRTHSTGIAAIGIVVGLSNASVQAQTPRSRFLYEADVPRLSLFQPVGDRLSVFAPRSIPASSLAAPRETVAKPKPRWAKFASHEGNLIFLSAAVLLPLATDGRHGTNRSLRTFDTLLTAALLTEALKRLTRERRPDGTTDTYSFPSGHASAAFAVAAYRSRYHKDESLFWFAGAAAIAGSRVALNRHRPRDVVAGAILGTATAAAQTGARRGLVLSPIVTVDRDNRLSLGVGGSF